jgi:hypothetical protein
MLDQREQLRNAIRPGEEQLDGQLLTKRARSIARWGQDEIVEALPPAFGDPVDFSVRLRLPCDLLDQPFVREPIEDSVGLAEVELPEGPEDPLALP